MTMQDPISDMLTRIRNGQQRAKREVSMPASTKKAAVAEVLKKEGYIIDYRIEGDGPQRELKVELKYYEGKPVIACNGQAGPASEFIGEKTISRLSSADWG